jgi:hypothetical protein
MIKVHGAYHSFERSSVAGTPEVPHCPYRWPEPDNIVCTRELDGRLYIPSSEAEFVPIDRSCRLILNA